MTPERWARVKEVFHSALDRDPAARPAFVAEACEGDPALQGEVEALLGQHDQADGFLATPAPARPQPAAPALAAGHRLGPYEILAMLGAGGMGEVYRARDTRLGRDVAVKVLPAELSTDADGVRRFEHEARAASALNHPTIVTVYDVARFDGTLVIVMEVVEGRTLREMLRDGALPPRQVVSIAAQLAAGLAKAHAAGIVHRDLKPENVMVTEDGFVKILDFGLAKLQPAAGGDGSRPTATFSRSGILVGTAGYMSPEQARGGQVDFRADQFSLGAVLYEMATGQGPFRRGSLAESLSAVLNEDPPPLTAANPAAPAGLEPLVARCLAKEPVARYDSTRDLAAELDRLRDMGSGSPVSALLPGRRRRAAARMKLAAIVGAVIVAAATALFVRNGRDRTGAREAASVAVLPFINVGGGAEEQYFSDGLTEELIGALARVQGLRVAARTSSFAFQGKNVAAAEVARQLGVAHLIEGSVRRSGRHVRVSAQLVKAQDGLSLWSQSYDRDLSDVFAVQEDIGRSVAQMLELRLAVGKAAGRRVPDAAAYDLYLRGRAAWARRTAGGLAEAISLFQEAIDRDPGFAPAYAGMADAYYNQRGYRYASRDETVPRARAAAERALALDGTLAEAYSSLARIQANEDLEWSEGERNFRRAIELNPSLAPAHQAYALLLAQRGRLDEARREAETAATLDPLASTAIGAVGMIGYLRRSYAEARAESQRAHELAPESFGPLCLLAKIAAAQGSSVETLEAGRRAVALAPQNPLARAHLARAYASAGDTRRARELLIQLEEEPEPCVACIADVHLALGELDEALKWVARGDWTSTAGFYFPKVDPAYHRFRGDPRFVHLLQKLGLD